MVLEDVQRMRVLARLASAAGAVFCAVGLTVTIAVAGPLDAVVGVHATIPPDARTADTLGTERQGSGAVIDHNGLVLTIGYLIMEADRIDLLMPGDRTVPAEAVAYDYDSGFGLVRALQPLGVAPIKIGRSEELEEQSKVLVASFGEPLSITPAHVMARREFAGYWEYLLEDAIFTAPPHAEFGGAALLGADGSLLGIGSLFVADAVKDQPVPGNMFLPIAGLEPILDDLLRIGRAKGPSKPWLGVYTEEVEGRLIVTRVAPGGPAARAGLKPNDIIIAANGEDIRGQSDFYRKIWSLGKAGVAVPLTVLRGSDTAEITVSSGDRYDYLKLRPSY